MENKKNQLIFMASNTEYVQIFKASQTFKNMFTSFSNPYDTITINNEKEDIEVLKQAIKEYIEMYEQEEGKAEYKYYLQF